MRKKYLLSLLGFIAAAGLAGCGEHSAGPPSTEHISTAGSADGLRFPYFSVTDLQGHSLNSADLRGKVVLIDFWATWCAPCKTEMPGYQRLVDRYGPKGFAVVGLKFDIMQDTEEPLQFANRVGVRYPLAVATDELKQKFGGIEGLPTTMLYDRAGVLRKKVIGFEYTSVIETALKPLL